MCSTIPKVYLPSHGDLSFLEAVLLSLLRLSRTPHLLDPPKLSLGTSTATADKYWERKVRQGAGSMDRQVIKGLHMSCLAETPRL